MENSITHLSALEIAYNIGRAAPRNDKNPYFPNSPLYNQWDYGYRDGMRYRRHDVSASAPRIVTVGRAVLIAVLVVSVIIGSRAAFQ